MNTVEGDDILDWLAYDPETGAVRWKKNARSTARAGSEAGCIVRAGYRRIRVRNTAILAHRVAWRIYYGEWPDVDIDHINGDRADNRISNLRLATRSQNVINRHAPTSNEGGVVGVRFLKKERVWVASITVQGKRKHLGSTKHLADAVALRRAAEKRYFGEYAPTH